jgi:hypothetical protein
LCSRVQRLAFADNILVVILRFNASRGKRQETTKAAALRHEPADRGEKTRQAREPLNRSEWRPLHGVDRGQLHEARLQSHYAAQWLARAARAYIPPQPDDGHTSLRWDDGLDGFVTQPLTGGARLSLQISSLTLGVRGNEPASTQSFPLVGRSDKQARQWLGEQFAARDIDARGLDAPSPYEIPEHAIAQGASYGSPRLADALAELAAWYANADVLLARVRARMTGLKLAASPVCCWPHHFDLATLTILPTRQPDITGSIGTGFSPGDQYYDEPYFYVSVYPVPDPTTLPLLPAMGHWHTREFTAGIRLAHNILAATDAAAETDDFLQGTVTVALEMLAKKSL